MEEIIVYTDKYKGETDPFAMQQVMKDRGTFEYLIDDAWTKGQPTQRPTGRRFAFDNIEAFRNSRDTYFAWQELTDLSKSKNRPVLPEQIIQRLAQVKKEDLTLFIPWGVRENGEFGYKEVAAMSMIDQARDILFGRGISNEVLLMPADFYAIDINNCDPEAVYAYYAQVYGQAQKRDYIYAPWRNLIGENQEEYLISKAKYSVDQVQSPGILGNPIIGAAMNAAKTRTNNPDPELAAWMYLSERMTEADMVERLWRPIKLSMVAKNKDNEVDLNLPRLYLLPPELEFPWL